MKYPRSLTYKEIKAYFDLQLWRFQSKVRWTQVFGPLVRQHITVGVWQHHWGHKPRRKRKKKRLVPQNPLQSHAPVTEGHLTRLFFLDFPPLSFPIVPLWALNVQHTDLWGPPNVPTVASFLPSLPHIRNHTFATGRTHQTLTLQGLLLTEWNFIFSPLLINTSAVKSS
jgi:hypothetical protein